jgi:hypothetical protein
VEARCYSSQRATGLVMHIDHVIQGAGDHPDNLALAYASCNLAKNDAIEHKNDRE